MSDTPGLSVPLEVKLKQFERQLARLDSMVVKTANKIQTQFEQANTNMSRSFTKSAAASAQVFERAIQNETRAFQQLKASVDPAYAAQMRYEAAVKQVDAAVRMGAVSQKEANTVLAQARAAHLGAAGAATTAAVQASGFFKISGAGRFIIQNTANQIGDMAVQLQMGTDPARVMAQQLPQVFGGFGLLGGVLGTVAPLMGTIAAIGFPLAAALMYQGDNADDAAKKIKNFADAYEKAEAAINSASAAVSLAADGDLTKIRDMYGEISAEVESLIDALARLKVEEALRATNTAIDKFFTENTQVEQLFQALEDRQKVMADLSREIAAEEDRQAAATYVSPESARILSEMRADLEAMQRMQGISEDFRVDSSALASILEARDALQEALRAGDVGKISDAIATMRAALRAAGGDWGALGDQLAKVEDLTRQTDANTQRLANASGRVNFDGAAASAARMADEISRAVDAMIDLRSQGLTDLETAKIRYEYRDDPVGRAGALAGAEFDRETAALRKGGFENAGEEAYYYKQRQDRINEAREIARLNEASRPAKKSRGRGSRTDMDPIGWSDREITALERQIEMVGKSRHEIVALTAKYEMLDKARERGIDLDQRSAETGRTLRDEIDLQAQSIADLTIKAEQYSAQQEFMSDLSQDLKEGFVDAIVEGKNFGDVMDNVAKQLAKAALQAALFGDGPLAALFGGGSGIIGSIGASIGIPGFAAGTDFAPGGIADVGENGPERIYLPRGSRVIPNHKLGQVGGQSQVDVFVHPSGEFDARVRQVSGDVAVNVSGEMIAENNRQISQAQRR